MTATACAFCNLACNPANIISTAAHDSSAVLWVRATGQCQHGPLWLEDTLYRGDLYEFHNTIGSDRAQKPARATLVQSGPVNLLSRP
jgi:hypothetical protein